MSSVSSTDDLQNKQTNNIYIKCVTIRDLFTS